MQVSHNTIGRLFVMALIVSFVVSLVMAAAPLTISALTPTQEATPIPFDDLNPTATPAPPTPVGRTGFVTVTAPPGFMRAQDVIDLTATRVLANATATAAAFPINPDDDTAVATVAFGLGVGSMALVLGVLLGGMWWANRSKSGRKNRE